MRIFPEFISDIRTRWSAQVVVQVPFPSSGQQWAVGGN